MSRVTPESRTKKEIKKVLDKYRNTGKLYYYMPVPGGYGKQTLDYLGFICGLGVAIEAKAPGEVPTSRQELTIAEIRSSGTTVFIIDGTENTDTVVDLDQWFAVIMEINGA